MTGQRVIKLSKITKQSAAVLAGFALTLAMPVAAADKARPQSTAAARPSYTTQAPIVMLKDIDSGEILFSRGADKRFAPASMAKVMTAYVVLDLIKKGKLARDKQFTVSEATWKKWRGSNGGSTMFLSPGEKVSVDDLLKGLITVSGNDAAAAAHRITDAVPVICVRHPSYGGQTQFQSQISELYGYPMSTGSLFDEVL